jgi:hypothetical protein
VTNKRLEGTSYWLVMTAIPLGLVGAIEREAAGNRMRASQLACTAVIATVLIVSNRWPTERRERLFRWLGVATVGLLLLGVLRLVLGAVFVVQWLGGR